jgi:hypothetical protein
VLEPTVLRRVAAAFKADQVTMSAARHREHLVLKLLPKSKGMGRVKHEIASKGLYTGICFDRRCESLTKEGETAQLVRSLETGWIFSLSKSLNMKNSNTNFSPLGQEHCLL